MHFHQPPNKGKGRRSGFNALSILSRVTLKKLKGALMSRANPAAAPGLSALMESGGGGGPHPWGRGGGAAIFGSEVFFSVGGYIYFAPVYWSLPSSLGIQNR